MWVWEGNHSQNPCGLNLVEICLVHTSLPVAALLHSLIVLTQPPLTLQCTTVGRVANQRIMHNELK